MREGIVIQVENFGKNFLLYIIPCPEWGRPLHQAINKIKKIVGEEGVVLSSRAAIVRPRLNFILAIYKMQYIIISLWLCPKKGMMRVSITKFEVFTFFQ